MVHAVWATKCREHFLKNNIRQIVFDHIKQNAKIKQIHIDSINGYKDHVHVLLGLNADMSIAKTIQLIKGESSWWINKEKLIPGPFEWADEYYAVSVSKNHLNKVRRYISIQEIRHQNEILTKEQKDF
jgi:putative transposase